VLLPIIPIIAKPSNTLERRLRVKGQGKVMREEDGWWLRPRKKRNNRGEGWMNGPDTAPLTVMSGTGQDDP